MSNEFFQGLKLFFSAKEQVHNHWYVPVDNFQFVTGDFYRMIEKELVARKVPDLEITRVNISEGGLLSDKREYLRLRRERIVFDICAAPFGTGYFFSFRFVELPLGLKTVDTVVLVFGIALAFALLAKLFGAIAAALVLLALAGAGIWFLRNALALGLKDLDANLMKTPIIGPLYEIFVRKETYHREDTRLMYLTTVNFITKALVDEVTSEKGIRLVKRYERKSTLGELYQEQVNSTDDVPDPAPA